MAIDITASDNYTELLEAEQGVVDTAVVAIKAAYAGVSLGIERKFNIRELLREQVNSMEDS